MGLSEANVARMGPSARRQIAGHSGQKNAPVGKVPGGQVSKYNSCPDSRGKLRFDSRKEARRYDELMARMAAGEIWGLRLQVDFTLQEAFTDLDGERVRAIRYRADFVYQERGQDGGWNRVVEDVKSAATKTPEYQLKRKMMLDKYGVKIREIL